MIDRFVPADIRPNLAPAAPGKLDTFRARLGAGLVRLWRLVARAKAPAKQLARRRPGPAPTLEPATAMDVPLGRRMQPPSPVKAT